MKVIARFLGHLSATKPWLLLLIGAVLCAASVVSARRIQVRTAFKDLMSADDPHVRRLNTLAENFPGAITIQVLLEGPDADRLVDVARRIEAELVPHKELIRAVYLEQEVDFFARRALLYLPEDELRRLDGLLAKNGATLQTVLRDPSALGFLRAIEEASDRTFPAEATALSLSTRVSGRLLEETLLSGNPQGVIGLKADPGPLREKLRQRTLDVLEQVPLPPSEAPTQETLRVLEQLLSLLADALERGDEMPAADFHRRVEQLLEVDLSGSKNVPARFTFSADKRLLLLEIGGVADLTRLENIREVLAVVEPAVQRIALDAPDVKIGLTGMPVMYAQEQDAILDNFLVGTILGLLGVLAIIILGFEQVAMPALSTAPLLMGILWAFGVQGVVAPELNMLNLLFPAVLFGLGTDYAIQILNAYLDRRARGDNPEAACVRTLVELLPGLFVGATTTAVAFYILCLAQMKGLRDLGFTAGTGVLTAVIAMATMLPPLLVLWDRYVGLPERSLQEPRPGLLSAMGALVERHCYPVLAAFLLVTCVFAYFVPNVSFERDASKVQPTGMPAGALQQRLLEAFQITSDPSIFIAKDLADAERIRKAALVSRTIASPLSVTMAIPERQAEKKPLIEAIGKRFAGLTAQQQERPAPHAYDDAELRELKRRVASLKSALLQLSFATPALYGDEVRQLLGKARDHVNRIDMRIDTTSREHLTALDRLLAQEVEGAAGLIRAMTTNTSITIDDVPRSLVERVAGKDGRYMVIVRANAPAYADGFLDKHVDELNAISPEVTGVVPVWHELLRQILEDIPRLCGYVAIAICLLVLVGLRSLRALLLSLLPLSVGLIWLFGVMGAAGIRFNFVSVLCLPILLGTGIDYGVYLIERIRHDRAIAPAIAHSGRALVLTAATTTIGFGSLMLSVHRGVFSLGLVTSLGILSCLAITLVLLPALVAIFGKSWLGPLPAPTVVVDVTPPPSPSPSPADAPAMIAPPAPAPAASDAPAVTATAGGAPATPAAPSPPSTSEPPTPGPSA